MIKPISQSEAHRLRKRVQQLERQIEHEHSVYASEFPGGVHIGTLQWQEDNATACAVYTARRLNHAVVAVHDGNRRFSLFAIPHRVFKP